MKKPILAFILNFFLLGLGYVYNGKRKTVGTVLILGSLVAIYVELQLKSSASTLYAYHVMALFLFGSALGGDAYREAKSINGR